MQTIEVDESVVGNKNALIGKKLALGSQKTLEDMRVAVICNWGDQCGIATYTGFLIDALSKKLNNIRIFSEVNESITDDGTYDVVRCWKRGESMVNTMKQIIQWKPDVVLIEHEFGIFPKATFFLQMLEMLDGIPYVVTLHSVYEHLDKTICTSAIRNILVHSQEGKDTLIRLGNRNSIYVVPHGCVVFEEPTELWNIFQNNYTILQFGFGFRYKGVDQAIDAVYHLKTTDQKFKNIFYLYLCSENPHTRNSHEEYYNFLRERIEKLGLEENVVIMRNFLDEKVINNYLRTAKIAIFPYKTDPKNKVYGASGAIRVAMANATPVIASDSHLFDDLEGVVPRISDHLTLATEIDKIFSDGDYRQKLIETNTNFVRQNNWDTTAEKHLDVFRQVLNGNDTNLVRIHEYRMVEAT
jgi:glycosyltransferase involved in cell wall biosynthesis